MYNRYMESLLHLFTGAVLWLALISLFGGGISFTIDHILFTHRRNEVWMTYHHPWWDKEGNIMPKHPHCLECESEVEKVGGKLQGHSTLE